MKIALINEVSQAAKNPLILSVLKDTAEPLGHQVYNYGMRGEEGEPPLSYIQNGILACVLLETGVVDFVVTGCGTGVGAIMALNSFPGVSCGFVADPTDAFLFAQINDGNAVSMPFAKGFGWGAELNLGAVFQKLFGCQGGGGYPPERAEPQKQNKRILDEVRTNNIKDAKACLAGLDANLVKGAFAGKDFLEQFPQSCEDSSLKRYVLGLMN